jgi:predicted thioredoxin/glutaredoxin
LPKVELLTKRIYRVGVRAFPRLIITFESEDEASRFVKKVGSNVEKLIEELNRIVRASGQIS